mmetsp:Transcript_13422/g.36118  ORF Transcript_13422/g.36118 Transcript_13422/m.36118 type:complete len:346 (+) Transcript_13422:77-1114(+)
MGQSFCTDVRQRGCWSAVLYPKVAPEWYRAMVAGVSGGNVHTKPAPKGSKLLLGYISLEVPNVEDMRLYASVGMGAGTSLKQGDNECRANFGPSQLIFPYGREAQTWPGEITAWVEDIRDTTDKFNMLGRTIGIDLVLSLDKALTGGEYQMKLLDPKHVNSFNVTEAPQGWAPTIRAIPHDPSTTDVEYPPTKLNALAIIDALVLVPSRRHLNGAYKFYSHFLMDSTIEPAGPTQYEIQVHFGPGEGLHQTLTFREDAAAQPFRNLGTLCIYFRERHKFVLAYSKCKAGGILKEPAPSRERVDETCEFRVRCIHDPEERCDLVPLEHVIRWSKHPDCPIHETEAK